MPYDALVLRMNHDITDSLNIFAVLLVLLQLPAISQLSLGFSWTKSLLPKANIPTFTMISSFIT
jgi:hypothetical protein